MLIPTFLPFLSTSTINISGEINMVIIANAKKKDRTGPNGWMDRQLDGRMDRQMNKRMDRQMDGQSENITS